MSTENSPDADPTPTPAAGDLAERFDAVVSLLRERGHLDGWDLTPSGELLTRIYHEVDLALAEASDSRPARRLITSGTGIGVVSFRLRAPGVPARHQHVWVPSTTAYRRLGRIARQMKGLRKTELRYGIPLTRCLDTGFTADCPPLGEPACLSTS